MFLSPVVCIGSALRKVTKFAGGGGGGEVTGGLFRRLLQHRALLTQLTSSEPASLKL